jgi:hypothetical protein
MLSTREIAKMFSGLPPDASFEDHVRTAMTRQGLPVVDWYTTRSGRNITLHLIAKPDDIAAIDKKTRSELRTLTSIFGYCALKLKSTKARIQY